MANKHRKVWKVVSWKLVSGKQTQPKIHSSLPPCINVIDEVFIWCHMIATSIINDPLSILVFHATLTSIKHSSITFLVFGNMCLLILPHTTIFS